MTITNFIISKAEIEGLLNQEEKNIVGLHLQYQDGDDGKRLFAVGEESGGRIDLKQHMIILKPLGEVTDGGDK